MDEKSKLIMEVAQTCFNTQGIKYTSIDEIVKECKISKSTFYKYFSTKENLVSEIISYSNEKFLKYTTDIDIDKKLNSKDKLKKKIIFILNYINTNFFFNTQILNEFPEINGKSRKKIKNSIRANVLQAYYVSLIDVYGKNIENSVWEVIFILDSLVHEFSLINRLNDEDSKEEFVETFILRTIDIYIENLKKIKPIINKSIFYSYKEVDEKSSYKLLEVRFLEVVGKIKIIIDKIENKKLKEAILKVEEQAMNKLYNSLIMDAMLAYLEKENVIKEDICLLNNLKIKLEEENLNDTNE